SLILAVLAGIAGFAAYQNQQRAERQTRVAETEKERARKQADLAEEQRDRAFVTQSRFLDDLARRSLKNGNAVNAVLLSLEALPDRSKGPDGLEQQTRPYVIEAERTLFAARYSLREELILPKRPDDELRGYGSLDEFSGDFGKLAAFVGEKTLSVLDLRSGEETLFEIESAGKPSGTSWSPDDRYILIAVPDPLLLDLASGTVRPLTVEGVEVRSPQFGPKGKYVVGMGSFGSDAVRDVFIWSTESGELIRRLQTDRIVWTASVTPDGKSAIANTGDYGFRLWDIETGQQVGSIPSFGAFEYAVSGDNTRLATPHFNTLKVFEFPGGDLVFSGADHEEDITAVSFGPRNRQVLTVSRDRTVRVWDLSTRQVLSVLRGHEQTIESATFSPDGARVVTSSRDGTVRVWDASTGEQLQIFGHEGFPKVRIYRDYIYSVGGGLTKIWKFNQDEGVSIGKSVDTIATHINWANDKIYSVKDRILNEIDAPSGSYVQIAEFRHDQKQVHIDKNGTIYSRDCCSEIIRRDGNWREFIALDSGVWRSDFALSPDGEQIATGSGDSAALVWRVSDPSAPSIRLDGHTDIVNGLAFSADG
ncbi:MAG: hypothetical protein KDD65_14475, partial [Bacteroidetes bacterium]|nr:hypothetical protein [Bacteroidota bacterium]